MPTVVVAPDKFKGSLTAEQVAAAVSSGLRRVVAADVVAVPVADGGDGTVAAALAAGYEPVSVRAAGPTGEPVRTTYARAGDLAVIEMADVSGLVRLPGGRQEPLTATSRGLGEVMAAAIDAGCRRLVLGIGGSASTDGGAGMLSALGARLLDAAGAPLADGGGALGGLAGLDLAPLRARMGEVTVTVACDVDNPLTGPRGAAAVYGPQKGASAADVAALDAHLAHVADVVTVTTGADLREEPGAGAAGGVGYAALAVLGARLRPGIDLVLDLVGFREKLVGADLVITGEGSLDEQTLHGKAPAGVAAVAAARHIPVIAVCGRTTLEPQQVRAAGFHTAYPLTDLEPDVRRCMAEAAPLLERLGERIAAEHLVQPVGRSAGVLP